MISPTVGRVVWYRPTDDDRRIHMAIRDEQPLSASVAYVFNDHLVNLTVSDHDGNTYPRQNVQLVQEGDEIPVGTSFAQWMPFQVGQAKKYEQAAEKLQDPVATHASIEQGLTEKLEAAVASIANTMRQRLEEHLAGLTGELHGIVDGRFQHLLAQAQSGADQAKQPGA